MNVHSIPSSSVVSIRHVAAGFMAGSDVILVVIRGIPHLVACLRDPDRVDQDHTIPTAIRGAQLDRQFGTLHTMTFDPEGLYQLAVHVNELRVVDRISEPVRWCCRENSMRDFSRLCTDAHIAVTEFRQGKLADLPNEVKTKLVEFSSERRKPRMVSGGVTKAVRARIKRINIEIAA